MKVVIAIVPPGGGEIDYKLPIEMPSVPQAGDHITIDRPGTPDQMEQLVVRKTWWTVCFLGHQRWAQN